MCIDCILSIDFQVLLWKNISCDLQQEKLYQSWTTTLS